MTWKILISAPYFLPVVEECRSQLEAEGLEGFAQKFIFDPLLRLCRPM